MNLLFSLQDSNRLDSSAHEHDDDANSDDRTGGHPASRSSR